MREEVILEIMGNQEESQKGGGLNQENQMTVGNMVKHGIRRKIDKIERTIKEINQKGKKRQMW